MGLKHVSLLVVMILLVTENVMVSGNCVNYCVKSRCHCVGVFPGPVAQACVARCESMCPPELEVSENSKGHHHHQHCKSGCSHHCHKHHNDKQKKEKCMKHCVKNCIIQAPSPSPSHQ